MLWDGERCSLAVFSHHEVASCLTFAKPTGAKEGFDRFFAGDVDERVPIDHGYSNFAALILVQSAFPPRPVEMVTEWWA